MTSIPLLAAVMLAAHHGAVPQGSMDPAAAAPPIENGTPAMLATLPATIGKTAEPGRSSAAAAGPKKPAPHGRRPKARPR